MLVANRFYTSHTAIPSLRAALHYDFLTVESEQLLIILKRKNVKNPFGPTIPILSVAIVKLCRLTKVNIKF